MRQALRPQGRPGRRGRGGRLTGFARSGGPGPVLALLLALAACGPEPDTRPNLADSLDASTAAIHREAEAPAPPLPEARAAAAAPKPERRCGWLSNPTPANWWLTDSQGQWILATQGADQAPGMEDMPDMSTAGWVETNGHYGYGCACMTITADRDGRVTRIADAQPRPLKQCRMDRRLPRPQ